MTHLLQEISLWKWIKLNWSAGEEVADLLRELPYWDLVKLNMSVGWELAHRAWWICLIIGFLTVCWAAASHR